MTTKMYRAEFFTTADYAVRDFIADSPQQALQMARQFYDDNLVELDFRSYESCDADLDQIQIWDNERGTLATWESDDYRLRKAAQDLLTALQDLTEAAKAVIDNWEKGDLAAAVRALDASISKANAAIGKAVPAVDILPETG
jgi:broad specificity phosphatase PhoE